MTGKKRKACAKPGCPAIHSNPGHYCFQHMRARIDDRPSAAERGYGPRWQHESKRFLLAHPFCECKDCRKSSNPLPATVVDHIIPHKGDPDLFWDISNWQSMAKRCHDRKTVESDGGFGR